MFVGWFLIILGVVFLLRHLGVLAVSTWGVIWPLLIIALGLAFLTRGRRGSCWCCGGKREEKKIEVNL